MQRMALRWSIYLCSGPCGEVRCKEAPWLEGEDWKRDGVCHSAYAVQRRDVIPGIIMVYDVDVGEVGVRREGM
jgi:hypothetical protein